MFEYFGSVPEIVVPDNPCNGNADQSYEYHVRIPSHQ